MMLLPDSQTFSTIQFDPSDLFMFFSFQLPFNIVLFYTLHILLRGPVINDGEKGSVTKWEGGKFYTFKKRGGGRKQF